MNATGKPWKMLCAILAASLATGCATTSGETITRRDATAALIRHPQFNAAANAAPQFVNEVLQVVTRYEAELALRK